MGEYFDVVPMSLNMGQERILTPDEVARLALEFVRVLLDYPQYANRCDARASDLKRLRSNDSFEDSEDDFDDFDDEESASGSGVEVNPQSSPQGVVDASGYYGIILPMDVVNRDLVAACNEAAGAHKPRYGGLKLKGADPDIQYAVAMIKALKSKRYRDLNVRLFPLCTGDNDRLDADLLSINVTRRDFIGLAADVTRNIYLGALLTNDPQKADSVCREFQACLPGSVDGQEPFSFEYFQEYALKEAPQMKAAPVRVMNNADEIIEFKKEIEARQSNASANSSMDVDGELPLAQQSEVDIVGEGLRNRYVWLLFFTFYEAGPNSYWEKNPPYVYDISQLFAHARGENVRRMELWFITLQWGYYGKRTARDLKRNFALGMDNGDAQKPDEELVERILSKFRPLPQGEEQVPPLSEPSPGSDEALLQEEGQGGAKENNPQQGEVSLQIVHRDPKSVKESGAKRMLEIMVEKFDKDAQEREGKLEGAGSATTFLEFTSKVNEQNSPGTSDSKATGEEGMEYITNY